jgi:nucleoside 2-deoxyribosyltransferase
MRDTVRVKRVYIAGPPDADEYRRLATELARAVGWEAVDPMRRDFRGRTEGNEREIVEGDLADIDACDAVLAAFTEPDEGTAMEAWYAWSKGKPVVAWTDGTWAHPWTVYVSRSVHERLEDAVAAVAQTAASAPRTGGRS